MSTTLNLTEKQLVKFVSAAHKAETLTAQAEEARGKAREAQAAVDDIVELICDAHDVPLTAHTQVTFDPDQGTFTIEEPAAVSDTESAEEASAEEAPAEA